MYSHRKDIDKKPTLFPFLSEVAYWFQLWHCNRPVIDLFLCDANRHVCFAFNSNSILHTSHMKYTRIGSHVIFIFYIVILCWSFFLLFCESVIALDKLMIYWSGSALLSTSSYLPLTLLVLDSKAKICIVLLNVKIICSFRFISLKKNKAAVVSLDLE